MYTLKYADAFAALNWYENTVSELVRGATPESCDRLNAPDVFVNASWPVPDCWVAVPLLMLVDHAGPHSAPSAPVNWSA